MENWFYKLFLMCTLFNKVLKVVIISWIPPSQGSNALTAFVGDKILVFIKFYVKNLFRIRDVYLVLAGRNLA